jgi:predicted lipoprotein with Yx(FWY)xxD motif
MRLSPRLFSFAGLALGAMLIAAGCTGGIGGDETPAPADVGSGSTAGPSASAAASVTLSSTNDPTLGAYLTGQNGMTLYVFARDPADLSFCSLDCATTWPPLAGATGATITPPSGATGTFATITRSDGIVQVTYNDMPLYYFSGDSAAGDTKGAGKDGVWYVAPLSGTRPPAPPTPVPSAS